MTTIDKLYRIFIEHPFVSTDSRKIKEGSIFFALKGENFNGNKFAADAVKKGAVWAVVDEKKYAYSENVILVEDCLETLQNLASFHRNKLDIPILAITGTNGKTTTKELVSAVLSQKFNVSFTHGNLNNHIGVPLTLLSMDSTTEFGIVEMGANHPGEIAELCSIAQPNYGLITNIGKAHLEGFGSFEGVKNTKAELYNFISKKEGLIFQNSDNPILVQLLKKNTKKITYGISNANLIGELIDSPPFVHLKANFSKGVLYLNTKLIGNFNFENILAAACIGNYFAVDPLKIQKALKEYYPQNNRSQLITKGKLTIIMDAYNANPTSMSASIKSFLSGSKGNKVLILGDMLELGKYAPDEHRKILNLILDNSKLVNVLLVGPLFSNAGNEFGYKTFLDVNQLIKYLQENEIKNGNILIKGSRGIQLEKALEYLN